jgi:hypothetical protein
MMGAIEYLGRTLEVAGVKFQVSAALEEVRRRFIGSHVLRRSGKCPQAAYKTWFRWKKSAKTPEVG